MTQTSIGYNFLWYIKFSMHFSIKMANPNMAHLYTKPLEYDPPGHLQALFWIFILVREINHHICEILAIFAVFPIYGNVVFEIV